ncbi:hypothetical protein J2S48_001828 [Promicromonospora iranensis]|uniref:Uncharacterized protein n=1 Tax=Promicromonospora iranensis TaxID=1105144 RepID=A0ABU2CLU3_9MICO|nr:hypothetical protein [Promicromonospora iranensis]
MVILRLNVSDMISFPGETVSTVVEGGTVIQGLSIRP